MKRPWASYYLPVGIVLLAVGIQLRAVETFELSAETTRILAGFVGPSAATPHGAVRQIAIDTLEPRHRLTPPRWLGWSLLSAGIVVTALGALRK